MQLEEANQKQLEMWDFFVDNSINGTLFHKRSFLEYHEDKFRNKEKFIVILKGTEVIAQISLALIEDENGNIIAKSPYGGSYGGFIFKNIPSYLEASEIVKLFKEYLETEGVANCFLTHPIACCSRRSMDTFYFVLLENGFTSLNRDISNVLYINEKPVWEEVSASIRSQIKIAHKQSIEIIANPNLNTMYEILEQDKQSRFGKKPTHTLEEFKYLHEKFPNEIRTIGIEFEKKLIVGITCLKINNKVDSSFYFFMNRKYQRMNALRPLVMYCLQECQKEGISYFDFGTSSELMVGKAPIFAFKEGFSRAGMFRETFVYRREKE